MPCFLPLDVEREIPVWKGPLYPEGNTISKKSLLLTLVCHHVNSTSGEDAHYWVSSWRLSVTLWVALQLGNDLSLSRASPPTPWKRGTHSPIYCVRFLVYFQITDRSSDIFLELLPLGHCFFFPPYVDE